MSSGTFNDGSVSSERVNIRDTEPTPLHEFLPLTLSNTPSANHNQALFGTHHRPLTAVEHGQHVHRETIYDFGGRTEVRWNEVVRVLVWEWIEGCCNSGIYVRDSDQVDNEYLGLQSGVRYSTSICVISRFTLGPSARAK
jgi:hypothetical protein